MYIYGKNVCVERIKSNDKIVRAYISKKFRANDIVDELFKRKIRVDFVDDKVLDSKALGKHQGIVLEVDDIKTYTIDEFLESINSKNRPLIVMLDHLEDPHNFGSIIRTC